MQDIIEWAKKTVEWYQKHGVDAGFDDTMDTLANAIDNAEGFPEIVCLCGSTRFWRTFQEASLKLTMESKIVLSIGAASGTDDQHFGNLPKEEYDRIKAELDRLHFRKIELANRILVLNVDGYIGESTRNELNYAQRLGKVISFWEEEAQSDD